MVLFWQLFYKFLFVLKNFFDYHKICDMLALNIDYTLLKWKIQMVVLVVIFFVILIHYIEIYFLLEHDRISYYKFNIR